MKLFAGLVGTDSDIDLYPEKDSALIACQAALDVANEDAAPHAQAWSAYLAAHYEDVIRIPWPEDKARLAKADREAQQTVERAAAALDLALTAAIERARKAWNTRILDQLRDDDTTITACIALLNRHEQLVDEASRAGVRGVHRVSELFITSTELRGRWDYARRAMGLT